ncbi:MAG: hypothetical protein OK422_00175 [Thaumarchaeota archaeon]|nr:hypothetical protein [Nitrososphaerota archaeon]
MFSFQESNSVLFPRRDLHELFRTEIFVHYGTAELGGVGFECPEHSGFHIISDFFICEVLRDGEAASPGETGELVFTSLENEAMPLIRYDIGDVAVPEQDARCGCGSSFPRLRTIYGRRSEGLLLPDGTRIPA